MLNSTYGKAVIATLCAGVLGLGSVVCWLLIDEVGSESGAESLSLIELSPRVIAGRWQAVDGAATVQMDESGRALLVFRMPRDVGLQRFNRVELVAQASPMADIALAWQTPDGAFARASVVDGTIDLSQHPEWHEAVGELLFLVEPVYGVLAASEAHNIEVARFELQAGQPGSLAALARLFISKRVWDSRSINTLGFSPLMLAALSWVLLSALFVVVFWRQRAVIFGTLVVSGLAAWVALDAFWLQRLLQQREATEHQFADTPFHERALLALDYPLGHFLQPVVEKAESDYVRRVLFVTPERFHGQRAAWQLLPIAAVWWPNPEGLARPSTSFEVGDVVAVYLYPQADVIGILRDFGIRFELLARDESGYILYVTGTR